MPETWIGGTQSSLNRGFLRATILRQLKPEAEIIFQTHDADSIGLTKGAEESLVIKPEEKGEWLPLYFSRPFAAGNQDRWCLGFNEREPYVLSGLRFCWPGLTEKYLQLLQGEVDWAFNFVPGEEKVNASLRAQLLMEQAKNLTAPTADLTISQVQQALAMFMLGKKCQSIELNLSSDYWRLSPERCEHEGFALLERFLATPAYRAAYNETMKHFGKRQLPPTELPFYALVPDGKGNQLRRQIFITEQSLVIGDEKLSNIRPANIQEMAQLISQHYSQPLPVVPKAIVLTTTLRLFHHYYTNKVPAYHPEVEYFARELALELYPVATINLNLAKTLGRSGWRRMLSMAKSKLTCAPTLYYGDYYSQTGNLGKLEQLWLKDITLLFAWIVGGPELINGLAEHARLTFTKTKRKSP